MANNLSKVFKEAKKYLWNGKGYRSDTQLEAFICHAIERTEFNLRDQAAAKKVVLDRLGKHMGNYHTVESYLQYVIRGSRVVVRFDTPKVQKYRKAWLTSLEKEFK